MPLSKLKFPCIDMVFEDVIKNQKNCIEILNGIIKEKNLFKDDRRRFEELLNKLSSFFAGNYADSLQLDELIFLCHKVYDIKNSSLREPFLLYITNNWENSYAEGLLYSCITHYPNNYDVIKVIERNSSNLPSKAKEILGYCYAENGPKKLAKYLNESKSNILLCTNHFTFLGNYHINLPYFIHVFREYAKICEINEGFFNNITVLLNKLTDKNKTPKIVLPQLIIRADRKNKEKPITEELKQKIIKLSADYIGEHRQIEKWSIADSGGLFDEVRKELIESRRIIGTWLRVKIINLVFTRLPNISYPERKEFWESYAEYMGDEDGIIEKSIRLIAADNYNYLKTYQNISTKWNDECTKEFAVLFRLRGLKGDYVIVDFLDGGCAYFYPYNEEGKTIWELKRPDVGRIKITDTKSVQKCNAENIKEDMPNTFRLEHRGEWEKRFDDAISIKIGQYNIKRKIHYNSKIMKKQ